MSRRARYNVPDRTGCARPVWIAVKPTTWRFGTGARGPRARSPASRRSHRPAPPRGSRAMRVTTRRRGPRARDVRQRAQAPPAASRQRRDRLPPPGAEKHARRPLPDRRAPTNHASIAVKNRRRHFPFVAFPALGATPVVANCVGSDRRVPVARERVLCARSERPRPDEALAAPTRRGCTTIAIRWEASGRRRVA